MKLKKSNIIIFYILSFLVLALSVSTIILLLDNNNISAPSENTATSSQNSESESVPKENVIVSPPANTSSEQPVSSSKVSSTTKPAEPSNYNEPQINNDSNVQSEEEDKSEWFKQLYSLGKTSYISELKAKKIPLQSQRDELYNQRKELDTEKLYAQRNLMEQFANMGLLDSGQYKTALNNLNARYNRQISELDSQISALDSNLNEINSEINNPDPNQILAVIAVNNNLTASQVVDYYDKYMK